MSYRDFFLGRLVDNQKTDSSTFDSTTVETIDVPAGKRWYFLGGHIYRDNNSTLSVTIRNGSAKTIKMLANEAAAATTHTGLPTSDFPMQIPFPMDASMDFRIVFGTAQGAVASLSAVVLEVDI